MLLTKDDLKQIKKVIVEAVDPYFSAIQKDFGQVYGRFDRIEKFMLADHKRRIERLEEEMKELRGLLAA
jgi:archaellum component FlaC